MKFLLLVFSFLFTALVSADNLYSMADLSALEKKNQWQELLSHLSDIKPAQRDVTWEKLVDISMSGRSQQLYIESNTKKIFEFFDKFLPLYPSVLNNKEFMNKRADYGLDYYSYCFRYNDIECHKQYLGFIALDPNKKYAFKIAKMVRRQASDIRANEYFRLASPIKDLGQCDDTDLAQAVYAGLTSKPNLKIAKVAQNLAFGSCMDVLKSTVKKAIRSEENGVVNSCELVVKHNSISGTVFNKCKRYLKGK